MTTALAEKFQKIELFNAYAHEHPAVVGRLIAQAGDSGLDGIVKLANGLHFDFSTEDVREYVRERAKSRLTESELATIAGGDSTTTYTSTFAFQNTIAATTIVQVGEVVTIRVVVIAITVIG